MIQLLDAPSAHINERLLEALQEIVHKIEIHPNFCVSHSDYKDWEFPTDIISRVQKMPQDMQQKYLSLQLQNFLYSIYYNGSLKMSLDSDKEINHFPLDLENNTF